MTKKLDIIYLNGFMYAVDKKAIASKGERLYSSLSNRIVIEWLDYTGVSNNTHWKIIVSNDPSLGLPLLPHIEDIIQVPKYKKGCSPAEALGHYQGFIDGYKAAKAKKYTENDLFRAMNFAITRREKAVQTLPRLTWPETDEQYVKFREDFTNRFNEADNKLQKFLELLNPKPIQVEIEMWNPAIKDGKFTPIGHEEPKVDKNNFVTVVNWIYEKT